MTEEETNVWKPDHWHEERRFTNTYREYNWKLKTMS